MGRILLSISLRNLFAHKTGTSIVGFIIFFGTFLVVMGTAILDSVDRSMAESITSSIAGHLQIYSKDARDELALFGGGFMGGADYGEIPEFGPVRQAIEALPNVRAVIPMGLKSSIVTAGNEIDVALEALRAAVKTNDAAQQQALVAKLQSLAIDIRDDLKNRLAIAKDKDKVEAELDDLRRILSDDFWRGFTADPDGALMYLDTHLAPLAQDGWFYYLRNLGTDLKRFADLFDRFELVQGEMVPEGERGLLIAKRVYERHIKHRVAVELDKLNRERQHRAATFEKDVELSNRARRLRRQYSRITHQLSVEDADDLGDKLRKLLEQPETEDLNELVKEFLTLTDDNFDARYAFFYETIAPTIRLYALAIGQEITLRSITKSGYRKALKIKIYGIYRFTSLEDSDLAGAQNLIDMISFRELYGIMTEAKKKELDAIRAEVGLADIGLENAEELLFGGDSVSSVATLESETTFAEDTFIERERDAGQTSFDRAEIDNGLAINAAILLNDPEALEQTQAAIQALCDEQGFNLQVIDWQTASGIVGQFIYMLRLVLYIAIFIIFVVALVIINNSMVMATLERTAEIGTMRAIGAQRRFIMLMFLLETSVLGLLSGTAGVLAGAATIQYLGIIGIPAPSDVLVFLFSGPRLYPTVGAANMAFGFFVVLLVSLASTLYPAHIATRIQPIVAMQQKE